jgi:hypothetical protein
MSRHYDDLDLYDEEHPSIENSLEDFLEYSSPELDRAPSSRRSPLSEVSANRIMGSRSTVHSEPADSDDDGESDMSTFNPPGWQTAGLRYYRQGNRNRTPHAPLKSPKTSAFRYGSANRDIAELAANIPLPASMSPEKRSVSPSKQTPPRVARLGTPFPERAIPPHLQQSVIAHTPEGEVRDFSVPAGDGEAEQVLVAPPSANCKTKIPF